MRHLEVIAHPTRLAILRHLVEHGAATAPELADAAGVHPNTIRPHIQALEAAGVLVAHAQTAAGPGRPAVDYRLVDEAGVSETDFRHLAELIATALARLDPDDEQLRRTGDDWGRYLVGRPGASDAREQLLKVLRELGFLAKMTPEGVTLRGCPCPLISPERPRLVCCLTSGVIAGALAAAGSPLLVGDETHDTSARRCSVQLIRSPET